ncbi:UDP-glucose dehydrogenase family protein [Halobacillus kuroshimensis]|uniref:UDP-glucose dehydrogenase family protein n=1 Tax=Halobacillus kuroshimensis TaxID=302481 RepID=UPI000415F355|nr:UDP-glucose/GDP-mannose dehydrogenase family protein [Halobacillus kuroshimensis]
MKITVVGSGYVGLVTGVCLAEMGHRVIGLDIDEDKVQQMRNGISPIYEPGIEEWMVRNVEAGRLLFTTDKEKAYTESDIVMVAVGTPQRPDGSADLSFIESVVMDLASYVNHNIILVIKSTVPVGTNHYVKSLIDRHLHHDVTVQMASNPEFLREGTAIKDCLEGDRIVLGAENQEVHDVLRSMYRPFGIPIYATDIRSAELIKYASNAFLATKISFINEIAAICEKVEANVDDVAEGMGKDKRIGPSFLRAGIGYGGSCFPKDTTALVQIAGDYDYPFRLLESVIQVNTKQQNLLVEKALKYIGHLEGLEVALLGLSFKPNTDDMREAPSIAIAHQLVRYGANIRAYDPVAVDKAKGILPSSISYKNTWESAVEGADIVFILTEWDEIKQLPLKKLPSLMKSPNVFDGRNCFSLVEAEEGKVNYYSIGRPNVLSGVKEVVL